MGQRVLPLEKNGGTAFPMFFLPHYTTVGNYHNVYSFIENHVKIVSNHITLIITINHTEPNCFYLILVIFIVTSLLIFIQAFLKDPWDEISVIFGWSQIIMGFGYIFFIIL